MNYSIWWLTCSGVDWWGNDYTRHRTGTSTTFTCMDDMIGRRKAVDDYCTTCSGS